MKPHKKITMVSLSLGLTGLAITICLNLFALVILNKASAEYFSDKWWSNWFPSYIVWFTFAIIGIGSFCWRKPNDSKEDAHGNIKTKMPNKALHPTAFTPGGAPVMIPACAGTGCG
jgi:hypothetical protein